MYILGRDRSGEIPHLATFGSRLAQKWTRVENLTIERVEWRVQDLDLHSVSLDLGCLTVYWLGLHDVRFPSILMFWHLVCIFPKLKWLSLRDVKFVRTAIDAQMLSALRLLSPIGLHRITLFQPEESGSVQHAMPFTGLLAHSLPFIKTSPWHNVLRLDFWDVTLLTAAAFGHLLCAIPTLECLFINGPCTFSGHGFNPSDVPLHPSTLSK